MVSWSSSYSATAAAVAAAGVACIAVLLASRPKPPQVTVVNGLKEIPIVQGWLPLVGCGLSFARNPRAFLLHTRSAVGDTFILRMFGANLLFVFSARGVKSLYQLPEADASFTEATRAFLALKIPQEIIAEGNLRKFHVGLKTPLLRGYLRHINNVVDESLATLGAAGEFEIFHQMKKLVFQIGLRCWVGEEVARSAQASRLIAAFEVLDPETAFQDLRSLVRTWATGQRHERAAILEIELVLREIWANRSPNHEPDNLSSLHELYADLPEDERHRKVSYDVFHFLVASQANMYAALSWVLINMLTQDASVVEPVNLEMQGLLQQHGADFTREFDVISQQMPQMDNFIQESLRLVQQSITLRKVMSPIVLETEDASYAVPVGFTIATLLSITNVDDSILPPQPDLRAFVPDRYKNAELDPSVYPVDKMFLVSSFGHGRHACPGQKFAMSVLKSVICKYLTRLHFVPKFGTVEIPQSSVGAIARATHPCVVYFTAR